MYERHVTKNLGLDPATNEIGRARQANSEPRHSENLVFFSVTQQLI